MDIDHNKMCLLLGSNQPFAKRQGDRSPVYFQLAERISQQIEKGQLAHGDLIPSERQIAKYNVISLATVRKAFDELVTRGLVKRIQGKGSYVTSTSDRLDKILYYPLVKGFDNEDPFYDIHLKKLQAIGPIHEVNDCLACDSEAPLYMLERVLLHRGVPAIRSLSYLPQRLFPNLDCYDSRLFESRSFYLFIEREFNITTVRHSELLSAVAASKATAEALGVSEGSPVLKMEMKALTHRDKPYEYRESYCLTDTLKLRRNF